MASPSPRVRLGVATIVVLGLVGAMLWILQRPSAESYSRTVEQVVAEGKPGQRVKVSGVVTSAGRVREGVDLVLADESAELKESTSTVRLTVRLDSAEAYPSGAAGSIAIATGRLESPVLMRDADVIAKTPSKYGSGPEPAEELGRETSAPGPRRAMLTFLDALADATVPVPPSDADTATPVREMLRRVLYGDAEPSGILQVRLLDPVAEGDAPYYWPLVQLEDGSWVAVSMRVGREDAGRWTVRSFHSRGPVNEYERALVEPTK